MAEYKRLYRSRVNKAIAGVCGGLAEYFDMDPVIWRLIFVALTIFSGSGILIYLILWLVLPENPSGNQYFVSGNDNTQPGFDGKPVEETGENYNRSALWSGIILIVLGILFLLDRLFARIHFSDVWPVLLIIIGALLLYNAYQESNAANDAGEQDTPDEENEFSGTDNE